MCLSPLSFLLLYQAVEFDEKGVGTELEIVLYFYYEERNIKRGWKRAYRLWKPYRWIIYCKRFVWCKPPLTPAVTVGVVIYSVVMLYISGIKLINKGAD